MADFDFKYLAIECDSQSMEESVDILRLLAGKLVDRLLHGPIPATRRGPALTTLLPKAWARTLSELHIWKLKGTPAKEITKVKKKNKKPSLLLKDLIERAITGKVKPREWQITFQRRLVKEVGGVSGSGLPYGMETLLEIAAWSELRFRHTLAVKVNDYLRGRVLFLPGEQRVPDFSPGVFWALIGLCDIGNYKNQVKYGDMLRAVREEARKQAMKEGWAGAWDQWLIRLARQQWPRAFENRKNEFCQALLGLPVFPQRSHEHLPDKKTQKKSLKKKSLPIVLAHPDWENQMMDVLKNSF